MVLAVVFRITWGTRDERLCQTASKVSQGQWPGPSSPRALLMVVLIPLFCRTGHRFGFSYITRAELSKAVGCRGPEGGASPGSQPKAHRPGSGPGARSCLEPRTLEFESPTPDDPHVDVQIFNGMATRMRWCMSRKRSASIPFQLVSLLAMEHARWRWHGRGGHARQRDRTLVLDTPPGRWLRTNAPPTGTGKWQRRRQAFFPVRSQPSLTISLTIRTIKRRDGDFSRRSPRMSL